MADFYFLDRTPTDGYNPTRISNTAVYGGIHGGLLQTPPRFFSTPSIHGHQLFHPFLQQQQPPPPLLPPPPPVLRPHRSLPSQPRSKPHSLKKSKFTKRDHKDSPPAVDRRVHSRTLSTAAAAAAAAKRVVRVEEFEKLSGCLFGVISPPPSSLPLPKFSLRPAKAEA